MKSFLNKICLGAAGLGGVAIFVVSIAVTISVVLRNLGLGGIRGDFELVELACATCASLFLPLCQLRMGHVMVDLFTNWMKPLTRRRFDAFWTAVFALGWAILCWRLSIGMSELRDYGDRTMLLQAPIWVVFVPAIIGTGISAIVAVFMSIELFTTAENAAGEI